MKTKFSFNPLDPFYTDNEVEIQDTNCTEIILEPWQLEVLKTICDDSRGIRVMCQDENLFYLIMKSTDAQAIILKSEDALIAIYQNPIVLHRFLKMVTKITPEMFHALEAVPYALNEFLNNKAIFKEMFIFGESPEFETLTTHFNFFIRGLLKNPLNLNLMLRYNKHFKELVEESPLWKGEIMRLMKGRTILENLPEVNELDSLDFVNITSKEYLEVLKNYASDCDFEVSCMVISYKGNSENKFTFIGI